MKKEDLAKKNRRMGLIVCVAAIGMIALAYASVPLYNLFCRVTGFGGTTQVATTSPEQILDRSITVKFDASTARDMPWDFAPLDRNVTIHLGEKKIVMYEARNPTTRPVTGTALYNVVPAKAGEYFHKIACFCFDEQLLEPGETMKMPVAFYVDPALNDDPNMADVSTITLSYTFFKTDSSKLDLALEDFYNQETENSQATKNTQVKNGRKD